MSSALVRPLWQALPEAARPALLRAAALTDAQLLDPDARLTASQFARAWDAFLGLAREPRAALQLAASIPAGAFGVVEYLCRSAPDLGEALRQWCRFLNLLNGAVRVELVVEGDVASVRVVGELAERAPASHELCFALLARHARSLCGPGLKLGEVCFAHPEPPGGARAYRDAFGAPVHFGAERTELVLPRESLALPLTSADPQLAAILERHASALQAPLQTAPPLTAQVQALVREGLRTESAEVERIAAKLALTARSLQRRLRDEGTTFQAVREGVRRELASRYLDGDLSFAEISFLLGFSEPSAFFRAFKRWTGATPEASRAARRAAQVSAH